MSHSRSEAVIAFVDLAGFSASTDVYGELALAMLGVFETTRLRGLSHGSLPYAAFDPLGFQRGEEALHRRVVSDVA